MLMSLIEELQDTVNVPKNSKNGIHEADVNHDFFYDTHGGCHRAKGTENDTFFRLIRVVLNSSADLTGAQAHFVRDL